MFMQFYKVNEQIFKTRSKWATDVFTKFHKYFYTKLLKATIFLIAVKLGEHNEALDTFGKALDMAKLQVDKAAESAIKKAIDDVNQKIVKALKDSEKSGKNLGSGSLIEARKINTLN